MRAVRSRGRTSFSHTTRSTPVFLAGDLYTIPEVLAQRADQRAAPRGVPIPGASQVGLELAGRDEVGERLLRERGREAVSRPLGGDEGGHERAGQHEVRDPQRREERL